MEPVVVSKVIRHDVPSRKERPTNLYCPGCDSVMRVQWKMYADICGECNLVLIQY